MSVATYIVIGIQVVLSLVLVVTVLMQSGNQRGLSGSIAGGAETFFGKNKGRTLDAKLKKWTAVIAALFLISSIVLGFMIDNGNETTVDPSSDIQIEGTTEGTEGEAADEGVVTPEGEAPAEGETETEETAE